MGKKIILIFLFVWVIFFASSARAEQAFYGKVVGTEFSVIQVRGDDGKISVFWMGYKTHVDSRIPFFGDRVRIEYIKDKLGRNAVTRVTLLKN